MNIFSLSSIHRNELSSAAVLLPKMKTPDWILPSGSPEKHYLWLAIQSATSHCNGLCSNNLPTSVGNVSLGIESKLNVMWQIVCKGDWGGEERERNSCKNLERLY